MRTIIVKIETDSEESFDLIKDDIEQELSCCWNWTWFDKVEIFEEMKGEQKVGKWVDHSDDGYVECPFCKSATNCDDNINELHYCFSCGAKMEVER